MRFSVCLVFFFRNVHFSSVVISFSVSFSYIIVHWAYARGKI